MRAIILAAIVAAGIGFIGTPGVSAAPANGVAIGENAAHNGIVTKVQHWRWGSRGRWRCHARRWSGWRC